MTRYTTIRRTKSRNKKDIEVIYSFKKNDIVISEILESRKGDINRAERCLMLPQTGLSPQNVATCVATSIDKARPSGKQKRSKTTRTDTCR